MNQSFLKKRCVIVKGLRCNTFYLAYRVLYQFGRDQSQPIFPLDYTNEDYGGQKPIFLKEVWEKCQKDDSHKQLQKLLNAPYVLGVVEERSDLWISWRYRLPKHKTHYPGFSNKVDHLDMCTPKCKLPKQNFLKCQIFKSKVAFVAVPITISNLK